MRAGPRRGAGAKRAAVLGLALLLQALPSGPTQATPPAAADARRSGREDMGPALRAMQDDDAQNPRMLWLQSGRALWQARSAEARSCADCHSEPAAMRGVAPRYPAWDAARAQPITLAQRITQCRVERQRGSAWATESDELLSLEVLVAQASRGLPITPSTDARLDAAAARGHTRFGQRLGQLDLSCADCHDRLAGGRLGGSTIPQGHPTGYPLYRLEWQTLGSLQRRLRTCLVGVRAEPWPDGAVEWTELELHLKRRAAGLPIDTPAVRP